ncbi:hypothetical protein [Treponema succinifaciens]
MAEVIIRLSFKAEIIDVISSSVKSIVLSAFNTEMNSSEVVSFALPFLP